MKNVEKYKYEIANYLSECVREDECGCDRCEYKSFCDKTRSMSINEIEEWLFAEVGEPVRLTQFEYDLIATNDQLPKREFDSFQTYKNMMKKGYFKGVYDTKMRLERILELAQIVHPDTSINIKTIMENMTFRNGFNQDGLLYVPFIDVKISLEKQFGDNYDEKV